MRPRTLLLDAVDGFDLNNLSDKQKETIFQSPFIFLVFLAEACGFWDGKSQYHSAVSIADEGHILFTYV